MKYVFGLLVGLILGVAVGCTLFYFNPLIDGEPGRAGDAPFSYALDGGRLLATTRDTVPGMPLTPSQRPALWERGLRGIVLESFVIADGAGNAAAVATKLTVPSPESDALRSGILTDDHWLVTLPGRGSFVAAGQSNIWPLLRDTVVRVDMLNRPWDGAKAYSMLRDGSAGITGVSGDYRGIRGALRETVLLDDYPRTGFGGLAGRLDITFDSVDDSAE